LHEKNKKVVKVGIYYRVSMYFFCLSLNLVYLLYFCSSLDRSKINKQGCGLARRDNW